ncbi:MAG TPA: AAA family ATPase, partial [Thermomicrobiales bacterium]|nr:AAA family ATPase [Thermomicrobiales bacterium]
MDAAPDRPYRQPLAAPLVGRAREQAALREALDAALAGRGALVLIGGEAGIGKTALAEALLAEAAERGALALVGCCYDLSETPPYGPWAEAVARAPRGDELPALPAALLPPERDDGAALAGRPAIARRLLAYLAALAARRPLALLLEDLHWADPATLDLLRVVARGLGDLPVLLLCTYRADEVAHGHPLAPLLPALVREARAARLAPRPLTADDLRALVRPRYALAPADEDRLVAYLDGRSEGNPLSAGEVLRALEEAGPLRRAGGAWAVGDLASARVPPLLRQVIEERAARLGEEARRLLGLAAVLGQEVPLGLWAAVSDAAEDDLIGVAERAVAARLLAETPDGVGVRFAHPLIRAALYEGLGPLRQPGWHRRAAEALLATPAPDPDAVAYHLQRAGDPRAVEWLVRAGLRARHANAILTAADRFRAAATRLDGDAACARERAILLLLSGRHRSFSDTEQALRDFTAAASLAAAAGDRGLAAYCRFRHGMMHCYAGAVRPGVAEMARAMADLDTLSAEEDRRLGDGALLAALAVLLPAAARPAFATDAGIGAAAYCRCILANWLAITGHYREALAQAGAAIAALPVDDERSAAPVPPAYGEVSRVQVVGPAHRALGHAHAALGRPAEAQDAYARDQASHRQARDLLNAEYACWFQLHLVALPYRADDLAARAQLVAEARRAWSQAQEAMTAATHDAQADLPVALLEGRWAEACQVALGGLAAATLAHRQGAIVALSVLARHQGEPDAAWARVRELHPDGPDAAPGDGHFPHGLAALAVAADLALDAGDLAAAGGWIAAHGRWLDWSGAVLWRAEHLLLRARHARLAGDLVLARDHAARALACATAPRQPLALLAAHRALGELATAAGRHADAATHLDAALALADACAAPYERALTLLAWAEAHAATGEREAAETALAEARAILAPLQAQPALARAAALAARLAAPSAPPRNSAPPAAPPGRLSRREAEVL